MPRQIETPPLALRGITSVFDTSFKPLYTDSIDFVTSCLVEVWPGRFNHIRDPLNEVESRFWTRNPHRVNTNLFGVPGDVLVWMPDAMNPTGFMAIRTPGHKVVTSSPCFDFTSTGRMQVLLTYFRRRPDIVVRF